MNSLDRLYGQYVDLKDLLNNGVEQQPRILDTDLVDDKWYIQMVNRALEQAERTGNLVDMLRTPSANMDLLTRMVAESNRSLYDETSAGTFDFFQKKMFHYSFDYLPFPHELETNCYIDTVANKMVLPGAEKSIGVALDGANTDDPSAVVQQNGNTVKITNLYKDSSTLSFNIQPNGDYNVAQFQIVTNGLNGEVVSVKDEDDMELLTSSITLSSMRIVRLYLPYSSSVLNVKVNLRPTGSSNSGCVVRNVYLGRRKYEQSGSMELGMEASGDLEVTLGFDGEGSVSLSTITDGTYESSFSVYSDRPVYLSCDESFRLMFSINAGENSTPTIKYLSINAKAGIPDVLL